MTGTSFRQGTLLTFIIAVCALTGCSLKNPPSALQDGPQHPPRWNVVLITISTLRADHTSCLGYHRAATPDFEAFAKQNILFRRAFATSGWTMPAHGSIFTSLYPAQHGATHIDKRLGDMHQTIAEILSERGYYCAGFCCNPRLTRDQGFAQGFDFYDDFSAPVMLQSTAFADRTGPDINKQRTNDLINDAAFRWLHNNARRPFFLFVHYYDNHWDYLPPAPYDKLYDPDYAGPINGTEIAREPLFSNPPDKRDIEHIVALYDGEVRQTDGDLGEMLNLLKHKGLLETSIVFITGDHGEQFYEHGRTSHHGVFEELIHVPLAVRVPENFTRGKVIDALVSQVDVLPTVLDYLQIPLPERCRGRSLRPLIDGRAEKVNDFVFAEYTGGAVPDSYALRASRYKYCQTGGEQFAFDLLSDPREQRKILSADCPPEMTALRESFKEMLVTIKKNQ